MKIEHPTVCVHTFNKGWSSLNFITAAAAIYQCGGCAITASSGPDSSCAAPLRNWGPWACPRCHSQFLCVLLWLVDWPGLHRPGHLYCHQCKCKSEVFIGCVWEQRAIPHLHIVIKYAVHAPDKRSTMFWEVLHVYIPCTV